MSWTSRPAEVVRLLNPAFCGEVLRRAIARYEVACRRGMPFPLLFLVLPLVLHRETRSRLPRRLRNLHPWLQSHQDLLVGFPDRAKDLVKHTREAISFLLSSRMILLTDGGALRINPSKRPNPLHSEDEEVNDVLGKAETLGRLLHGAGTPDSIFSMLGVKP